MIVFILLPVRRRGPLKEPIQRVTLEVTLATFSKTGPISIQLHVGNEYCLVRLQDIINEAINNETSTHSSLVHVFHGKKFCISQSTPKKTECDNDALRAHIDRHEMY